MFRFVVYRDCDTLRVRKVVIELYHNDRLVDRRRMFAFPLFTKRLKRKQRRMLKLGAVMVGGSWTADKKGE